MRMIRTFSKQALLFADDLIFWRGCHVVRSRYNAFVMT